MTREFSIYLDLVRFLAALLVLSWHSNLRAITTDIVPFSGFGHSAVIVFFVLSGYVIAYVSDTKERTFKAFAVSRFARIYSVAPVALVLALVLDPIGESLAPHLYHEATTHDFYLLRLVSSLLFLNEVWGISIMAFSNAPYWSLNYEVWYYVLFAVATYLLGRKRVVWFIAIALMLGPKILLLGPIWWLGALIYRTREHPVPEPLGWTLFLLSLPLIHLFHHYALDELLLGRLQALIGPRLTAQLAFSKYFLSDYLLGLLVAMNFIGFRAIAHQWSRVLLPAAPAITFVAGFTFSLYLFHQPLILFFAALIDGNPDRPWFLLAVITCVLLSVLVIGTLTEKKKGPYRRFGERLWDLAMRHAGAAGCDPATK